MEIVYLDNAATTYPKPKTVLNLQAYAMVAYGGNPGRSGHRMSMETAAAVFKSRLKCADFFGAEPENCVFTQNCTHALNMAIKGVVKAGAHIIISDIEHNAVLRPVHALSQTDGVSYSKAVTSAADDETLANIERLFRQNTAAVVMTAASNVTGKILPFTKIAALCERRGVCFILDAAQAAGVVPIRLSEGINVICAPGHKGLYGPMGTGLMLTDNKFRMRTIIEGGTGSRSKEIDQPEELPDRFESGTINTPGSISLGAGVDFVTGKSIERISAHERNLCRLFREEAEKLPNVTLYTKDFGADRVPVIPFNIGDLDSAAAASKLSDAGFYLRGGFHCAPLAHIKMGTYDRGCVRFAPSAFNTERQINNFIAALKKLF